jgi:hypothetical protein
MRCLSCTCPVPAQVADHSQHWTALDRHWSGTGPELAAQFCLDISSNYQSKFTRQKVGKEKFKLSRK